MKARFIFPMNLRFLTLACLVTAATFAADAPKLPSVAAGINDNSERRASQPTEPIAKKKERLFSDDFGKRGQWENGVRRHEA